MPQLDVTANWYPPGFEPEAPAPAAHAPIRLTFGDSRPDERKFGQEAIGKLRLFASESDALIFITVSGPSDCKHESMIQVHETRIQESPTPGESQTYVRGTCGGLTVHALAVGVSTEDLVRTVESVTISRDHRAEPDQR